MSIHVMRFIQVSEIFAHGSIFWYFCTPEQRWANIGLGQTKKKNGMGQNIENPDQNWPDPMSDQKEIGLDLCQTIFLVWARPLFTHLCSRLGSPETKI